jgi:hypothetical protein
MCGLPVLAYATRSTQQIRQLARAYRVTVKHRLLFERVIGQVDGLAPEVDQSQTARECTKYTVS